MVFFRQAVTLLIAALCTANAVNYIYDENLFSKDTWHLWKLDNPLESVNPADELAKARPDLPDVKETVCNSLDGPEPRKSDLPKQDALSSDVGALEDEAWLEPASKASQCIVCHVLLSTVWTRITNDIINGESISPKAVSDYLSDACKHEAVDATLKKYTIFKMESDGGAAALLFFVVRERRSKGSATDAEEAAVALSCQNLLKESGDELASVLLQQAATYRREALRALTKHDRDGGNVQQPLPAPEPAAEGAPGRRLPPLDGKRSNVADDDDDEYMDPDDLDDAGNVPQKGPGVTAPKPATSGGKPGIIQGLLIKTRPGEQACVNLNEKCEEWASRGECEANPNYMIGSGTHVAHCRRACGLCSPSQALKGEEALLKELDALSDALLLAAKNLGCGAGKACLTGVSGTAVGAGLVKQPKKELPQGIKEFPGGFVLGRPWYGIAAMQRVPIDRKQQQEQQRQAAADAAAKAGSGSEDEDGGGARRAGGAPTPAEVDRVLRPVLGNTLLHILSDFFIYEFMYKNHTRQFHANQDGQLTEDYLLGRFQRESTALVSSTTGEVAGLDDLDLLPDGEKRTQPGQIQEFDAPAAMKAFTWPYVKHVYAGGDQCVLAGGRSVVRRVESRLACSPDDNVYMLVREPDFCTYIYVVYVPQLCSLDYYKPRPKAAGGGAGAGKGALGKRRAAHGGAPRQQQNARP